MLDAIIARAKSREYLTIWGQFFLAEKMANLWAGDVDYWESKTITELEQRAITELVKAENHAE